MGNSACSESTGSNRIDKNQGRVTATLVLGKGGKNGQCDLVRAERLQMIGLMVVMLMSYSRVVMRFWFFWELFSLFYGMGMEFRDKKSVEIKCQQDDAPGI